MNNDYNKLKNKLFLNKKNTKKARAFLGKYELIHISLLTINTTINNKNCLNIGINFLINNLQKSKNVLIEYQGKTRLSKRIIRSFFVVSNSLFNSKINNVAKCSYNKKKTKMSATINYGVNKNNLKKLSKDILPFFSLNKMLGANLLAYHYRLLISECKDSSNFMASEKSMLSTSLTTALSKAELTYLITQILYKINFLKRSSSEKQIFKQSSLSNIIGALIVLNSSVYFISSSELKQCGKAEVFENLVLGKIAKLPFDQVATKLDNLFFDTEINNRILLNTKIIKPNISFCQFLNTTIRASFMHDFYFKSVICQLVNILEMSTTHKITYHIRSYDNKIN